MWFGTDGGLNKYDGYSFTAYKHDPDEMTSISDNIVYDLMQDHDGNLWAATHTGLDKFDREKDRFTHYHPGTLRIVNAVFEDSKKRIWAGTEDGLYVLNREKNAFEPNKYRSKEAGCLQQDFIYKITEDDFGNLWIATQTGLKSFNPDTQRFVWYKNDPSNSTSIGADWIRAVYKDTKGNLWAGSQGGGIARYNRLTNSFVNYRRDAHNSNSISHNDILSFCNDADGNLWIGTENGGISVFNYSTGKFISCKNDPNDLNSLSNNSIYTLYKDNLGGLWIGTYSEGVNFMPRSGDKFLHYNQNVNNPNSLNDHTILSIAGNGGDDIWIGTDGGGLNRFNQKTKTFTHYLNDINNKNSINSNYVISVVAAGENLLALGLHRGGFDLFNTKTGRFTHHMPEKGNPNSLSTSSVNILYKARDGNIWLGTWGGGLDCYNPAKNIFTHFKNNVKDTGSIVSNFIYCIFEDSRGDLWVSSGDGLDRLNKTNNSFIHYHHSDGNKKSLSQNFVQHIFEDHAKNLWFGTSAGLNLLDRKTQTFTAYTEKDGLPDNMIQSIMEDRHGNLWLASNDGITRFNPQTKAVRNYNASDGLQGKEFKPNSCFQTPDGKMFFGGTNGFNVFHPDSLKDNDFVPPVYITNFEVFNKQVVIGGKDASIQQQINEAKEITLSYKQSVFSFEFSALNYTLPSKNQYSYMLEGFDKDWIIAGSKRTATYTNLDPKKYIFHVKGSNNDGVWNEKGTSVIVTITPPFWMTWWFKIAVLLLVCGSAAAFYIFRINTIKAQKQILQQKVKEQTGQLLILNDEERKARHEADEANRAKSVFLATMSHEIRTPMNGVIGMAQLLMQTEQTDEQRSYAKTITTCGEGLLSVINGILDFSKIESGKMELENNLFNLQTCVEEALDIFSYKAAELGLQLGYKIAGNVPAHITSDCLRLRQILINLVGNAIKFTPKGEVFISVHLMPASGDAPLQISFEVRDTGIGIPADKIKRLFKAFSQVDSSTTRKYGGSGLGLLISEKLVGLMGGKIEVASETGKGSTFTFSIQTTDKKEPVGAVINHHTGTLKNGLKARQNELSLSEGFAQQYPLRILIAEDNAINLLIAKKVLSKLGYMPASAGDGAEVVTMLNGQEFDLILMDVQMPLMDGLDATRAIRMNKNAQQPVIVAMTANAMQGDKEECLHAGMDDYLSKPISIDALVAVLKKWAVQISVA